MNDMLSHQFENQDDVTETMSIMNNYIVPCLPCILQSGFTDDTVCAEEIREKWCSFLGQEIGGMCQGKGQRISLKFIFPFFVKCFVVLPMFYIILHLNLKCSVQNHVYTR